MLAMSHFFLQVLVSKVSAILWKFIKSHAYHLCTLMYYINTDFSEISKNMQKITNFGEGGLGKENG